jgi:aspartate aminotransferase/aminotransferase
MIAQRARAIDASGIRRVFDLAANLKDPINLSIGLPDFDVPGPVKQAAKQAIDAGFNRYTPTQGIEPLRAKLAKELKRPVEEVFITSGVSGGLFLSILATVDPGAEVLFLDPYFVMYRHLATMAGGVSVTVDSYPDFRFNAAKVEAAITPRTKLLILNTPSNPTGVTMTEQEIYAAADLARRHDLLVVADEIYVPFLYGKAATVPSLSELWEKTILLRGFSKTYGMTGWRMAYAAGPSEVIEQMIKMQQYTYVCAPSPFQQAAMAALDLPEEVVGDHVVNYRKKRDIVRDELAGDFELTLPDGAFYVFPKVPERLGLSGTQFCERMIERNVLVIPGGVFSGRDTHFRISFAIDDARLREGCRLLRQAAA